MKNLRVQFTLPVSILKEGDAFVAYTPVLDLSTSGNTFEQAQKNFVEAVNLFFEELMEMGTADEVLKDLGWQKQDNNVLIPPVVIANQTESFSIPLTN
ncbi:type II toxin-antitoxin system HicB family antitoxin [Patescibacteria group bacterium]|nr:type II toxin-antitoxin system HicB family antitoxin [Patescibacteria group bacterium]